MTVKEFIEELECFDANMEVVMQPSNSRYVDGINGLTEKELTAFFGKDRQVLVIISDGQEGAV